MELNNKVRSGISLIYPHREIPPMFEDEPFESEDHEQNVYGAQARERLEENDEISPEEEAFMEGYESDYDEDESEDDEAYEAAFEEEED